MERNDEFNKYIDELKKIYEKNPDKAIKEARNSLERLGHFEKKKNLKNILDDIDKDLFLTVTFCILIALFGLLSPSLEPIMVYIFGEIFFLAGLFVGLFQKGFGLIFLFSHGMTGLGIMTGAFLSQVIESGLMTENPNNVYIYIGIVITIYIIALFFTILVNLSDNLKKVKYIKAKVIGLYGVGLLLIALLPRLLKIIINL